MSKTSATKSGTISDTQPGYGIRQVPAGWLFLLILFSGFPLLYTELLAEPENSIRYLAFSLLVTIAILIVTIRYWNIPLSFTFHPITKWLIAVTAITLISVFMSFHKWEGVFESSKWVLQLTGFGLLLLLFSKSKNVLSPVIICILVSFGLFLGFALIQAMQLLQESKEPAGLFTISTLINSNFSNKNFFSESQLMMLPFLLAGAFLSSGYLKYLSILCLLICVLFLGYLQSLAVISAFACSLLIMCTLWFRYLRKHDISSAIIKRNRLVMISIAVFLFVTTLIAYQLGAFNTILFKVKTIREYAANPERLDSTMVKGNDNSVFERVLLTRNSVKMFSDHPVFGNGLANWRILFSKYGVSGSPFLMSGRMRYEHPHNEYLFILAETGMIGFIAWMGLIISVFFFIIKALKNQSNGRKEKLLFIFLAGGIVSFSVVSIFSYPRERFFSLFLLLIIMALVVHLTTVQQKKRYNFKRLALVFVFLLTSSITCMHAVHVKSELYFRAAQNRQVYRDFPKMLRLIQRAESRFYPLDFTSTPLVWYKGMAYYNLGDSVSAFHCYQQAVEENPWHVQAWNDLGSTFEKLQKYPEAMQAFHTAIEINPGFRDVYFNAGVTQLRMGQVDSALYFMEMSKYSLENRTFKKAMWEILAYSAGDYASQRNDTLLVKTLNSHIEKDWNFLIKEYEKAGKNRALFHHNLEQYKK